MISTKILIAVKVTPTAAKTHAPFMQAACTRFGITSPAAQAAFIGQCLHETQMLTAFEENLFYSRPERVLEIFKSRVTSLAQAQTLVRNPKALANTVYANRYGNGDAASGDGWTYRGRGGGHLTFRAQYAEAEAALGRPYEAQPDLVAQPEDAALTFAWYFSKRGCIPLAEAWNIDGVTAKINPGMAAAAERRQLCNAAAEAFKLLGFQ